MYLLKEKRNRGVAKSQKTDEYNKLVVCRGVRNFPSSSPHRAACTWSLRPALKRVGGRTDTPKAAVTLARKLWELSRVLSVHQTGLIQFWRTEKKSGIFLLCALCWTFDVSVKRLRTNWSKCCYIRTLAVSFVSVSAAPTVSGSSNSGY